MIGEVDLKITFTAEYSKPRNEHTGYHDVSLSVVLPSDTSHTEITEAYNSFLRALGYHVAADEEGE